MQGLINWKGFNRDNPKHVRLVAEKIDAYLSLPDILAIEASTRRVARVQEFRPESLKRHGWADPVRFRAHTKEFTTKAQTPDWFTTTNVVDMIQTDIKNVDTGWAAAFRTLDIRGTTESGVDILSGSSGLTFAEVKTGERAKIYQVTGTKLRVDALKFGAGLGFDRTWWDDQKWYKIEEQTTDFRSKEADKKANLMYSLITAVTDAIAFNATDIATINDACADLIVDNDGVTPGITDGTMFLLYHHPSLKSRIFAAMAAVTAYTTTKSVTYNVTPVSSPKCSSAYLGWMVAPAVKNVYVPKMDLTILSETDIMMFAENVVGWTRYNGYINAAQVRRLAKS